MDESGGVATETTSYTRARRGAAGLGYWLGGDDGLIESGMMRINGFLQPNLSKVISVNNRNVR